MYRKLVNEDQSAVHIIPEYSVFNGSAGSILVKEKDGKEFVIERGQTYSLPVTSRDEGLELSVSFLELEYQTQFIGVECLGMKVGILYSSSGLAMGRVYIQTAIASQGESRLVVKIGNFEPQSHRAEDEGFLKSDFLRGRARIPTIQLTLHQVVLPTPSKGSSISKRIDPRQMSIESEGKLPMLTDSNKNIPPIRDTELTRNLDHSPLTTLLLSGIIVDYQRVFKDDGDARKGNERAQFSLILHNFRISDDRQDSAFPMVFDSTSAISFLDLRVLFRGPLDANLVQIPLFDLNLAHANGVSKNITITTSEDFVWKLFDEANRILKAVSELAGFTVMLEETEDGGSCTVKFVQLPQETVKYAPPKGDKLYNIDVARVSPFKFLFSFQRNPQASRYKKVKNVPGAQLLNYITKRLKFSIDRAELKFARFEGKSMKGPPNRLLESLYAVYVSRMKFKVASLLTAASFEDWKFIAARTDGNDEFVDGDVLRATGNLAGTAAARILGATGRHLGGGVSGLTQVIGSGLETATTAVGAGNAGAGMNRAVRRFGDGVGGSIAGGEVYRLIFVRILFCFLSSNTRFYLLAVLMKNNSRYGCGERLARCRARFRRRHRRR